MPRVLRKNGESGHVAAFEFEHSFVGTCVQRRSESAPDIHENRIDIILVAAFLIRAYLLVVLNLIEFEMGVQIKTSSFEKLTFPRKM